MKLLIFGKFPPIQGGVSMRTFHLAHALAKSGHEIHVITNAKKVNAPQHIIMRDCDWQKCETQNSSGTVKVHWNDSAGTTDQLVSVGRSIAAQTNFDAIFSFYMKPYAVVGHLLSQALNLPHIIKTAGSDIGRLWEQAQFKDQFNQAFLAASMIITGGTTAQKLINLGVDEQRIRPDPGFAVPLDLFTPSGPTLNIEKICREIPPEILAGTFSGKIRDDIPYLGLYGKFSEPKGVFHLLNAIGLLVRRGQDVGMLVLGQGEQSIQKRFETEIDKLQLTDHIVQLPFLPPWRIPEFIRRCNFVCCLEQNFPVTQHRPIIAREILSCGGGLIASTEILRKLPNPAKLISGYNCIALKDTTDHNALLKTIGALLPQQESLQKIKIRARQYAEDIQKEFKPRYRFEDLFQEATAFHHQGATNKNNYRAAPIEPSFQLFRLVCREFFQTFQVELLSKNAQSSINFSIIEKALGKIDGLETLDKKQTEPYRDAIRLCLFIAKNALLKKTKIPIEWDDHFFRFDNSGFKVSEFDMAHHIPVKSKAVVMETFNYDANEILGAITREHFRPPFQLKLTHAAILCNSSAYQPRLLIIDDWIATILNACNGVLTGSKIQNKLEAESHLLENSTVQVKDVILYLFESGLVSLNYTHTMEKRK